MQDNRIIGVGNFLLLLEVPVTLHFFSVEIIKIYNKAKRFP